VTARTAVPFTRADQLLIVITWLTYASFYLGRLNISPALPVIADDLAIGLGQVGILGTVFFVSYAIGQVIMGQLGNIFNPRLIIFAGLVLIALSNVLFSWQRSLVTMSVLWGVNGLAQAMGWGPMLRVLSSHLSPAQVSRISVFFSISFQIGTAVAWGLAGFLVATGRWQNAFLVPGILLLIIALAWLRSGINVKENIVSPSRFKLSDMLLDVRELLPILATTACVGFVYIGILLWLPTLILEWDHIQPGLSGVTTAIFPLVGIPGMLLAGRLLVRQANVKQTIMVFLLILLGCLVLTYLSRALAQSLFVLATVMVVSGLAGLLLSSTPLLLSNQARVSSAGGLLTAVWSAAGGLSGTIVGSVAEVAGWSAVILLWGGATIGAIIALFTVLNIQSQKVEENTS
jgi:sugar phosphate permease